MSCNPIDVNAVNRLTEEERALMSKIGKKGGQAKSEKKRLALIENLKKAREAKALINKSAKQSDESNVS